MDDLNITSSRRRRRRRRRNLPGFRRKVQSEREEDYLSNLPDHLLSHILSFLPTLDSIRSSVLGRRWRHVWTSVPVIDFSYVQLKLDIINGFLASRGGDSVSRLHLSGNRLEREIMFIVVYNSDVYGLPIDHNSLVYNLVKYAKSHHARHVTLRNFHFEYCSDCFLDLLFDWPSLVSLNLHVVRCKDRTFFESTEFRLSNLKTLSLALGENVIPNESLARLLSGCPVLEELTLNTEYPQPQVIQIKASNLLRLTLVTAPEKLQITCQKLEYLRLKPYFGLKNLHIEAPSLTRVRLCRIWCLGTFAKTFAKTLFDVTAVDITVSDIYLWGSTPSFMRKYKAIVEGFPVFHKLLELKIKMYVAEQFSLDIVFDLLRCTPNLQSLVLTESKKRPCDEDFDEWESSSSRIKKPLEHLKRVSVNIKSERIRSTFLKTLSEGVPAWDRITIIC